VFYEKTNGFTKHDKDIIVNVYVRVNMHSIGLDRTCTNEENQANESTDVDEMRKRKPREIFRKKARGKNGYHVIYCLIDMIVTLSLITQIL